MRINNFGCEDECIKIYDVEKKEMIAVFPTYSKAERAIGISSKIIRNAGISKKRKFSPVLNKEIAIRIAAKEKT
jgi:hypothetical protein